ncbi:sigma-70 family RNA polymerase sigma factor [Streptomyces sp. M19]
MHALHPVTEETLAGSAGPPARTRAATPARHRRTAAHEGGTVSDDASTSPHGQPLPLDFEAFYLNHVYGYHEYARTRLGDEARAVELVHRVFLQILDDWEDLLCEGDLEQRAWATLRQAIHIAVLRASQANMRYVESRIGLYQAMAELSERQYDVLVLRHVIGYSTRTISRVLGIDERTVDYHGRRGKERLRVQLRISAPAK